MEKKQILTTEMKLNMRIELIVFVVFTAHHRYRI